MTTLREIKKLKIGRLVDFIKRAREEAGKHTNFRQGTLIDDADDASILAISIHVEKDREELAKNLIYAEFSLRIGEMHLLRGRQERQRRKIVA